MLVCENCKGTNIQMKAWVDVNTLEYKDSVSDAEEGDNWCEDCQKSVYFRIKEEDGEE